MKLTNIALAATLLAATFLASGTSAKAQSTEADISAKYMDKPLFLMGLWRDDKLKFDAQGHPLGKYQPASFTQCGMRVTNVTVSGNHVRLDGEREGITFDHDGNIFRKTMQISAGGRDLKPEKMSVEIDNGKSQDFGPALQAVFADDPRQLAPVLPDIWHLYFRKHFGVTPTTAPSNSAPLAEQSERPVHIGGAVQAPKLLHHVVPNFSEDARRMKVSGNVQVYLWVDENGNPTHISVVRPAGMGLDEKAVEAVSQYRFAPATREGTPVSVDLYIDVNFQIF